MTCRFQGNQVRLIGRADPSGGLADVYLDGVKQPVGIDCWTPYAVRHQQVLYYHNGLANGPHELKIVVRGEKNPYAKGSNVYVDAVQSRQPRARRSLALAAGRRHAQRMIFGYTRRKPYVDSSGHEWLPATEWIVRTGNQHRFRGQVLVDAAGAGADRRHVGCGALSLRRACA